MDILSDQRVIQTLRFPAPVPYRDAYSLQIDRRDEVEHGTASNALFLLEHPPTFTLGRNSDESHLLRSREGLNTLGIEVVEVDRGGDVTYHGPGQLVAYPILNLNQWRRSISGYLRALEEVVIHVLADYGIAGRRLDGYTGVWVDGAKVAAIGVGIHNWVTYHGLALNVATNMEHWSLIVPCGIPDKPITSLERLLGTGPAMVDVMERLEGHFRHYFSDPGNLMAHD